MTPWPRYSTVVFVDYEFIQPDGDRPKLICCVSRKRGKSHSRRTWIDGVPRGEPPYPIDSDTLICTYYGSAELGCHLAAGWPLPKNHLDLYAEFRTHTNGRALPCGFGLLGALAYFGLDSLSVVEKESMRELAMRGGPWTQEERQKLLDYCETDVDGLARLFEAMLPHLDLERALLRGRFMAAAAHMEHNGVPIDTGTFGRLNSRWNEIKHAVIDSVDGSYGVFDRYSFSQDRFEQWLAARSVDWPRLESGRLKLDDDTFKEMSTAHADVRALHELRRLLSKMRPPALSIGADGRNRCLLSAFRSQTGRNQPSNAKFVFGAPSWMRGLIQPLLGAALAYVDWCQQEFGIAAALSGDSTMMQAYASGDPYFAFAKQANAVPADATKSSHAATRDQFKLCVLGVQYGMGEVTLARRIGTSTAHARELLDLHRRTYPQYWRWSQAVVDHAILCGRLHTVYGWNLHTSPNATARSLANFPMQANGAEMLRLACIIALERRIRICAPVHDALLVEGPVDEIDEIAARTVEAMTDASRYVLDGFELRVEAKIIRYPGRLLEPRGEAMWTQVLGALHRIESRHRGDSCRTRDTTVSRP